MWSLQDENVGFQKYKGSNNVIHNKQIVQSERWKGRGNADEMEREEK